MTTQSRTLVVGALVIAFGSTLSPSLMLVIGLPLVAVGLAIAWTAGVRPDAHPPRPFGSIWLWLSATAGVAFLDAPRPEWPLWFRTEWIATPTIMLVLVGAAAGARDDRSRRHVVYAAVAAATVIQLLAVIAVPHPAIDVWAWTDACVRGLLHGVHPYTVHAADVYRGGYDFGYTATVYPYMPLTLVATAPAAALLGDYRFALALAFPLAVALLRVGGRRLCAAPVLIDAACLALAVYPHGAKMIVYGWNEPLLVLALAAFVCCAARAPRGTAAAAAFLLLPALKQYVVAPVALWAAMRPRLPVAFAAAGIAVLTVVPFLMWNGRATLDGILFMATGPASFRADSLSLAAAIAWWTGATPPRWLGPAAQFVVAGLAFAGLRRSGIGGLLLASALSIAASFLLGMQAFSNYFYFVSALVLAAAVVQAAPAPAAA